MNHRTTPALRTIRGCVLAVGLLGLAACGPAVRAPGRTPAAGTTALDQTATVESATAGDDAAGGYAGASGTADVLSAPRTKMHFPVTLREPRASALDTATGLPAATAGAQVDSAASGTVGGCAPGTATRDGPRLVVDGDTFAFFGINGQFLLDPAYPEDRVEPLLAALSARGVNAVRVWFMAEYDPERLARLLDAGARQDVRFVVTLADNVDRGRDWFFGDDDSEVYRPHLERTVARFMDRPEILMWEPTNEPNCGDRFDAECVDTIKDWLTMASRLIKRLDPCHLVSSGMIGAGNYDFEQDAYRQLHRRDTIDVLSVHRRRDDARDKELETAATLDRPIVFGEVYDQAYDDGCSALDGGRAVRQRADRIRDDLRDALDRGVDGYLLWDLAAGRVDDPDGNPRYFCGIYGYEVDDPVWAALTDDGLPPAVPWRAAR